MTERQKNGRFLPGQSGNPQRKPRGLGKASQLREAIEDCLPDVLRAVVARALAGDMAAARLLLERCMPALRPADDLVSIRLSGTVKEQAATVIEAVADGRVPANVGAALVTAIGTLDKMLAANFEERLAIIEEKTRE